MSIYFQLEIFLLLNKMLKEYIHIFCLITVKIHNLSQVNQFNNKIPFYFFYFIETLIKVLFAYKFWSLNA